MKTEKINLRKELQSLGIAEISVVKCEVGIAVAVRREDKDKWSALSPDSKIGKMCLSVYRSITGKDYITIK